MRGGFSRGCCDIGVPDLEVRPKTIRGRFEATEPDNSGFIVEVEGK